MNRSGWIALAVIVLASCSPKPATIEELASVDAPPVGPASNSIEAALAGTWRSDAAKNRDAFRHPAQTLRFCQVDPASHVTEVWPGGGWYSAVLVPWMAANDGEFTAAILDPASSARAATLLERYLARFSDTETFGTISHGVLGADSALFVEPDSQDTVLTFRNVHSWMGRDISAKVFADFYAALKPGGVLCVVEHRLPSGEIQDPKASTGYVQEAMTKALAQEAGFVFEAASEINANPKDDANHPFGVWTLPPVRRSPRTEAEKTQYPDFDRAAFDAIGESDRMTLRFRKPAAPEGSQ